MIDCGEIPTESGPWDAKWLLSFSPVTRTECGLDSLSALEHVQRENREFYEWILWVLDQGGQNRILERIKTIVVDALMSISGSKVLVGRGTDQFWLSILDSEILLELEMTELSWQNVEEQIRKV